MTCPYCNVDYTFDDSCFCHPPSQTRMKSEPPAPSSDATDQPAPALEPTGLSNPFWKV